MPTVTMPNPLSADAIATHLDREYKIPMPDVIAALTTRDTALASLRDLAFPEDTFIAHARVIDREALQQADAAMAKHLEQDSELRRLATEREAIRAEARGVQLSSEEVGAFRAFPGQRDDLEALVAAKLRASRQVLIAELPAKLAVVQALTTADNLAAAYDDVALSEAPDLIRPIGRVVLERLKALEATAPASERAAASRVRADVQARVSAWERAHPSAPDRLRRTENAIQLREQKLRSAHAWVLKAAKLRN